MPSERETPEGRAAYNEYMRVYMAEWREKNRQKFREIQRESNKRRRKQRNEMMARWRAKQIADPVKSAELYKKRRARDAVKYRIKTGAISRSPCEVCGSPDVQPHHNDYSKPLEVRWLCKPHHYQADTFVGARALAD